MYLIIYIDVYAYICIFIDPAELEEIGAVLKIRCNWSDLLVGLRFLIAQPELRRGARTEPRHRCAHSTSCTKIKKIDETTYNHRNPEGKKINFAEESATGIIKLATSLGASHGGTKTRSSDAPEYTTN